MSKALTAIRTASAGCDDASDQSDKKAGVGHAFKPHVAVVGVDDIRGKWAVPALSIDCSLPVNTAEIDDQCAAISYPALPQRLSVCHGPQSYFSAGLGQASSLRRRSAHWHGGRLRHQPDTWLRAEIRRWRGCYWVIWSRW